MKRDELKIWTSPWCSSLNLQSVRDEIKSSSVFRGRTVPFSHIMQISNKIHIPWGCSCAIYKVSSIDILSRWIIRLRDMTPSLKKYRVTKVVSQHVSDWKTRKILKKVFVEVSAIIMVFVLSFVWFVDWTVLFILEGPGHWDFLVFLYRFLCQKNSVFGIRGSLRFAEFLSFSIWFRFSSKIIVSWASDLISNVGFGFFYLDSSISSILTSSHYAPPLISNSRETSVCSTCQHCMGSIRVLRTGMWTVIGFDGFARGFRFWSDFFAVLILLLEFILANCSWVD